MRTYRISQGELWARAYDVKAQTQQQALEKYQNWVHYNNDPYNEIREVNDARYIENIEGDILIEEKQ